MAGRRVIPGRPQPVQLGGPARQIRRDGAAARRGTARRGTAGHRGTAGREFLLAEHGKVQLLSLCRRVGAELLGEEVTQLGVGGQGPGGLAARGQPAHQRPPGPLVVGVVGYRRHGGGRGGGRVARGERRLRENVPHPPQQLGLLSAGRLGPLGVRLIFQDQAGRQHVMPAGGRGDGEGRLGRGQPPLRLVCPVARLVQIDLDRGRRAQPVAGPAAVDGIGPEDAAQPADERRDVLRRAGRRRGTPQHLRDPVGRHGPGTLDRQQLEQRAGLAAAEIEGSSSHQGGYRRRRPRKVPTSRSCAPSGAPPRSGVVIRTSPADSVLLSGLPCTTATRSP